MSVPTLAGVTARMVTTNRISTRVLSTGPDEGVPVLFLHGNSSSATWWEETMLALPPQYRGIAPDLRGFGDASPDRKVDATRGAGDWADDVVALLNQMGIDRAHVVGNSLGGCVVWRLMMDAPARLRTVSLVDAGSPYGFGGTKDDEGTPCHADSAGSGGGLVNQEFIQHLAGQDRGLESPVAPRLALRTLLVKPPFVPAREEDLLTSMFTTHIGELDIPGDFSQSPNWPYVAPGVWGAANALSPKYMGDVERLCATDPKVDVLWVRGSHDVTVADQAAACPGTLGLMGVIPNYPGIEVFPPQPMLRQIRAVLERYAAAGGSYREMVIQDAGHVPFIEKPEEFNAILHGHIDKGRG